MAILDNPIFEYEEKKSVMTDENEAADAEAQGMSVEVEEDPVKLFAREMAKKWSIGIFKTINTLLLLALVLFAGFADQFNISWSKFNEAFPIHISPYGAWLSFQTLCQSFIAFFFVSLLFTVLYWIWRRKPEANKHLLGCIGIGDLTISIVAIPVLFNALLIYALMVTAEWKYFYPRLTNSSMSLTELTENNPSPYRHDLYRPYSWGNLRGFDSSEEMGGFHPPTTPRPISDWQIREMEQRKMKILIRMALDSSSLILLAILVFLNLISFFRIRKMIKRTNLWLRDFGEFHKESSKLDRRYANFWPNGLFKMLFWIVPFFSSLVNSRRWNIPHICLFSLVMFCHWLYFIRKTRFRSVDDLKAANEGPKNGCKFRFVNLAFFDILFALNGILFYTYFIYYDLVKFAFLLHLFHFFYLLILGGIEIFKGMTIKLPQISISVTVNVVKEGEKKEAKTNAEGKNDTKMPENGEQEEKKLLPI